MSSRAKSFSFVAENWKIGYNCTEVDNGLALRNVYIIFSILLPLAENKFLFFSKYETIEKLLNHFSHL
jgi:hypothetical protein